MVYINSKGPYFIKHGDNNNNDKRNNMHVYVIYPKMSSI